MPAGRELILFVTGRLAEPMVRQVVADVAREAGFEPRVAVVGISVAALMTTRWLSRKLQPVSGVDRVIVPGWCQGDLHELQDVLGVTVERGPRDILDLPEFFGGRRKMAEMSDFDIEILAEINHAPRLSDAELAQAARHYAENGADIIDLGCVPGESWPGIGDAVTRLRGEGLRISVDSFDRAEVEAAAAAGAELILSVNSSNIDWAVALPAAGVVIPDDLARPESADEVVRRLEAAGREYRVDPVLAPVGFGFAESLFGYFAMRRRCPKWPLLMGIGNVTELSSVDSAGINFLLATVCQELAIGSVLTTEVANWSRSAVREFDLARRLAKHAVSQRTLVKNVESPLLVLRDERVRPRGAAALDELSREITDPNYRIFVERGEIHVMNRDGYWRGDDPFELFDRFAQGRELEPAHAFYLGHELCKAVTALRLGKQYTQDEALRWGYLSWSEASAHDRRQRPPTAT